MDEQYDDTIPVRVVVTPTLIIPAYRVKRKRSYKWVRSVLFYLTIALLLLALIGLLLVGFIVVSMTVAPRG